MALTAGIERTDEFRVEGDLLTDVDGTLPEPVLSTPGMISMMEYAAARLVRGELAPGHATVGLEVCVKHVGGALEGATCTVSARLRDVGDGRKLHCDRRRQRRRGRDHLHRRHLSLAVARRRRTRLIPITGGSARSSSSGKSGAECPGSPAVTATTVIAAAWRLPRSSRRAAEPR